jgi:hypothetical protein
MSSKSLRSHGDGVEALAPVIDVVVAVSRTPGGLP